MDAELINLILWSCGASVVAALAFTLIGLVPGTSETATIAPATLMVILLGFPPAVVLSFCMAAVAAKHLVHAVPTAILGVPGDNMAIPMLEPSAKLRALGMPHVALQKMVAGGVLGLLLSVPISVGFAILLAPLGELVKAWVGPVFAVVGLLLAFRSPGRWASIALFLPYGLLMQGLNRTAMAVEDGKSLTICFMLGMALGPMFADVLLAISPQSKDRLAANGPKRVWLTPDNKLFSGAVPAPWNVLTLKQSFFVLLAAILSGITFTFTAIGMTFLVGSVVQARVKGFYDKMTTSVATMNATSESTYIAEILIPLIAFGLPLSPIALTVGFPLFNAPPIYTTEPINNLHNLLTPGQVLLYAMIAVSIASLITYPLAVRYARSASAWVMRHVAQEAVLALYAGLIVVLTYYEGGFIGTAVAITVAMIAGLLNRFIGFNIAAQMMSYFSAAWVLKTLFGVP